MIFDQHAGRAVKEPIKARLPDAYALTDRKGGFFAFLEARESGRIHGSIASIEIKDRRPLSY